MLESDTKASDVEEEFYLPLLLHKHKIKTHDSLGHLSIMPQM